MDIGHTWPYSVHNLMYWKIFNLLIWIEIMMYLRPIIFIFHWKTRGDPDVICLIKKEKRKEIIISKRVTSGP